MTRFTGQTMKGLEVHAHMLAQQLDVDASARMAHLSAMAEKGSWLLGLEFSNADLNGPVDYEVTGYQAALGYRLNANMQITAGWQWYNYQRNIGTFYDGAPSIERNGGFLTLGYEL